MANPTNVMEKGQHKVDIETVQNKKSTKRLLWKDEGVYAGLDRQNLIGVVAYNRIDLLIYTEDKSFDLETVIKRISRHVKYIIESAKIGNDDVIYSNLRVDYGIGKSFLFQSISIPFTLKSMKIFNSLSRVKDVENKNFNGIASFSFRTKNVMRIIVDPLKGRNPDVFFKGFIASARIPPIYVDNQLKADEKFHLRVGTFVSDNIGYEKPEIEKINRKELLLNKINLFGENTYKDEISYFIPIKRRISLIIYECDKVIEPGVLGIHRECFEIGLHYKSIKNPDGTFKDDFKTGPIGIFVSQSPNEELEVDDIRQLTKSIEGETLLYGSDNKESYDMVTFNDEAEIINKYLVQPLMPPEEKEEKADIKDAAAPAPENEEKVKEDVVEVEAKEEKPAKKTSKKSSKKKAAPTEEEKVDAEEAEVTFNDVGSLVDETKADE